MMKNNRGVLLLCLAIISTNSIYSQWVRLLQSSDYSVVSTVVTNGPIIYVGTAHNGVVISTDDGASWTQTNLGNTYITALATSEGKIFAGTYNDAPYAIVGFHFSTNNGVDWNVSYPSLIGGSYITCFAVQGNNLFAGGGYNGMYRSSDSGHNWTISNSGMQDTTITSLTVSGGNLVCGTSGWIGAYLSSNNGSRWTDVGSYLPSVSSPHAAMAKAVACLAAVNAYIFAGTWYAGLWRSTDNAASWSKTNLVDTNVTSLDVNGTSLFAGTNNGIYYSADSGTTWIQIYNKGVNHLASNKTDLFAVSNGEIYRRALSEVTLSPKMNHTELPADLLLKQNYPNPFNPVTTISFSLPYRSFVSLKVFDLLGREISTLLSEELPAGTYAKQFTAEGLASGIYLCRLRANDFAQTKKLTLLR